MTTTNNNSNTPNAAAWAAMSPEERSAASKEMLDSILRAESLNKDIQELLKVANADAAKEVLKELCEELGGKPLPAPAVIERNALVIAAAHQQKGLIADDHRPGTTIQLWGVATLDKGEKQTVVALFDSNVFSINRVYLSKDGKAHLCTSSVAGVMETRGLSMEDAIVKYNDEQGGFPFSCGLLNNVVKF